MNQKPKKVLWPSYDKLEPDLAIIGALTGNYTQKPLDKGRQIGSGVKKNDAPAASPGERKPFRRVHKQTVRSQLKKEGTTRESKRRAEVRKLRRVIDTGISCDNEAVQKNCFRGLVDKAGQ